MKHLKRFNENLENLPPEGGYLKVSGYEMEIFSDEYELEEPNTTTYAYAFSMFEDKWFNKINHKDIWLDINLLRDNWLQVEIQIYLDLMVFICDGEIGLNKLCEEFGKYIPSDTLNESTSYMLPDSGSYTNLNSDQFVEFSDTYARIKHYPDNPLQVEIDNFYKMVLAELPSNRIMLTTTNRIQFRDPQTFIISVDLYEDDWTIFNYYDFSGIINYYLCDGEDGIIKFSADWDKNKNDII